MRTVLGGVVLLAGFVAAGAGATAFAQATPPKAALVAPDPSLCDVEPRPAADLERIAAAPIAAGAPTEAGESGAGTPALPEGTPADVDIAAAAAAVVEELFACFNANDYPRSLALYTDEALAMQLAGVTEKEIAFLTEPRTPAAKQDWSTVAVREAVVLDDGRVGLLVESTTIAGASTDFVILVEEDGRYLIDEELAVTPAPSPATPAS
jgi:hypothetical protein